MQLPKYIDQVILEQLVYEQLGGFLLILQPNGKIVFVSHTVENLLGHLQVNISINKILRDFYLSFEKLILIIKYHIL